MGAALRLGAAVGGVAVAFVIVMLIQSLTPDPDLNAGAGKAVFERFQFDEPRQEFTVGSTVKLENAGGVPVVFVWRAPDGSVGRFEVAPEATRELTLDDEGTYRVSAEGWPWVEARWVARSTNPFERFLEDMF